MQKIKSVNDTPNLIDVARLRQARSAPLHRQTM